ncbi:MAG: hypothetical protein JWP91_2480 [Fibrobacteres bacterium]|nr:hypothetical protein [Fibrobacterota bacterium]
METATQSWTPTEQASEIATKTGPEGRKSINRLAENVASRTPSLLFMAASLASIAAAATLQIRGNRQWSLFVGQWAPSFLLFGLYTKLVKSLGAD